MNRRKRNLICIWIIFLGLANFVSYTVIYGYIGGDAKNGMIKDGKYYVRGHFLRDLRGRDTEVSRDVWIYSYIHSISIWPTVAAVLISTLIMAQPHIIATMKEGFIRGQTLITIFITVVIFLVSVMTIWFILDFIGELSNAG